MTEEELKNPVKSIYWRCKECSAISGLFDLDCRGCGRQRQNPNIKKDWLCPKCNQIIFASKKKCLKCNSKQGDWKCINCSYLNFASRTSCKSCKNIKMNNLPYDGIRIL